MSGQVRAGQALPIPIKKILKPDPKKTQTLFN